LTSLIIFMMSMEPGPCATTPFRVELELIAIMLATVTAAVITAVARITEIWRILLSSRDVEHEVRRRPSFAEAAAAQALLGVKMRPLLISRCALRHTLRFMPVFALKMGKMCRKRPNPCVKHRCDDDQVVSRAARDAERGKRRAHEHRAAFLRTNDKVA